MPNWFPLLIRVLSWNFEQVLTSLASAGVQAPPEAALAQAEFTSAEHVKFQRGSPRSWLRGAKTGYLARYAKLVISADKGAILEL